MLPFTKAESWPNIGFSVTAGSSETSLLNAALASSVGLGIFIDPRSIGLIVAPPPGPDGDLWGLTPEPVPSTVGGCGGWRGPTLSPATATRSAPAGELAVRKAAGQRMVYAISRCRGGFSKVTTATRSLTAWRW